MGQRLPAGAEAAAARGDAEAPRAREGEGAGQLLRVVRHGDGARASIAEATEVTSGGLAARAITQDRDARLGAEGVEGGVVPRAAHGRRVRAMLAGLRLAAIPGGAKLKVPLARRTMRPSRPVNICVKAS